MGQSVLVCEDVPQVLGAATCTSEVWVDSETLTVSSVLGLSEADVGTLAAATVLLWAVAYGVRVVVGMFK